jgi:hypothetical protein
MSGQVGFISDIVGQKGASYSQRFLCGPHSVTKQNGILDIVQTDVISNSSYSLTLCLTTNEKC